MPLNIRGRHIAFHRGDVLRKVSDVPLIGLAVRQNTDTFIKSLKRIPGGNAFKPDRPPRGKLPTLTVQPIGPDTEYLSERSRKKALVTRSMLCMTPQEIRDRVTAFIGEGLRPTADGSGQQGMRRLITVGDAHTNHGATMMRWASIAAVRDCGATLLMEVNPVEMTDQRLLARFSIVQFAIDPAAEIAALSRSMTEVDKKGRVKMRANYALDVLVAAHCGLDVRHGDPEKFSAESQDARERAIVRAIDGALREGAGPVVVHSGCMHLPVLRRRFRDGTRPVLSLTYSNFDAQHPDCSEDRRRMSELISHDDIARIRPGPGSPSWNPMDFAPMLGLDLTAPLPREKRQALMVPPPESGGPGDVDDQLCTALLRRLHEIGASPDREEAATIFLVAFELARDFARTPDEIEIACRYVECLPDHVFAGNGRVIAIGCLLCAREDEVIERWPEKTGIDVESLRLLKRELELLSGETLAWHLANLAGVTQLSPEVVQWLGSSRAQLSSIIRSGRISGSELIVADDWLRRQPNVVPGLNQVETVVCSLLGATGWRQDVLGGVRGCGIDPDRLQQVLASGVYGFDTHVC